MPAFTGTIQGDVLIGTSDDDIFTSLGVSMSGDFDLLSGMDGADTYVLAAAGDGGYLNYVISDQGTDGSIDRITQAGALYHSASMDYQAWATLERVGDNLVITLPADPDRFHDPGSPGYQITITGQFAGTGVELMDCGGTTYNVAASSTGTNAADLMGGGDGRDVLLAMGGSDFVSANGGNDILVLGAGNDTAFGGAGRDIVLGGDGDDYVMDEDGNDIHLLGDGQNHAEGGAGNDILIAGDGFDWLEGGTGNDRLTGNAGQDMLDGGLGDDTLNGGADGDHYIFGTSEGVADWGHDEIIENGNAPSYQNEDIIDLRGFYGPSSGSSSDAFAAVSFARDGNDMVISFAGDQASVTVQDMFGAGNANNMIEVLQFNGAYWDPLTFQIVDGAREDLGNDRDHGTYGSELNEVLFGTDRADDVFGGAGTNFIWLGEGADTLIYKLNDGASFGSMGGGASHDIVQDFNITEDRLDFSETELSFDDLTISQDADGDAIISWYTEDWEISDIYIELRGVSADQVTEDLFIF